MYSLIENTVTAEIEVPGLVFGAKLSWMYTDVVIGYVNVYQMDTDSFIKFPKVLTIRDICMN